VPKPVIEIDVNDAKFKSFAAAVEKFKATAIQIDDHMKGFGKQADEAAKKGQNAFMKMRNSVDNFNKSLINMKKSAADLVSPFTQIAKVIGGIAASIAGAAFNLAKWVAFGAIGGGFGLGALANSASDTRKTASGYGVSAAELRSTVAYRQYGDPEQLLGNIANTQNDPTKGWAYSQLGVNHPQGQNPMDVLRQVMLNGGGAYNKFKNNPAALGLLSSVLSPEAGRMLANAPKGEVQNAAAHQQQLAKSFDVADAGMRKFSQTLAEAGEKIETSLIGAFNKLGPVLSKLTTQITNMISKGLNSEGFKDFTNNLGKGIETLITDLPDIADKIGAVATDLAKIVEWIARKLGLVNADTTTGIKSRADTNLNNLVGLTDKNGKPIKYDSKVESEYALLHLIQSAQQGGGKSVRDILGQIYGTSANSHIAAITKESGLGADQVIKRSDLAAFMSAITHEQGGSGFFASQGTLRMVINSDVSANVTAQGAQLPAGGATAQ
jgi:hypothetical protein